MMILRNAPAAPSAGLSVPSDRLENARINLRLARPKRLDHLSEQVSIVVGERRVDFGMASNERSYTLLYS